MKDYIVFGNENYSDHYNFHFVNVGKEIEDLLHMLKKKTTKTGQSQLSNYYIIESKKVYPTSSEKVFEEFNKRRTQFQGGFFLVRYRNATGYKTKTFDFIEDLEYKLEQIEKVGYKEILVINTDEAQEAEEYATWNIQEAV